MTLTRSGSEIAEYFALTTASGAGALTAPDGAPLRPRYNIAPSQAIPTIVIEPEVGRRCDWKRWGLVPSWAKDPAPGARLFNARSETVALKPSFRAAFRRRRCLIPAEGFYEWAPRNRGHQPFYFQPLDAPLLAFAGLFESWRGAGGEVIDSCTLLTTEANPEVAEVHPRMPVILRPSAFDLWLDPNAAPESLEALFGPAPPGSLWKYAVTHHVDNPRLDDPACLTAAELPDQIALFELESPS
jgi:putative SOS response-associated peptidase YedK